jgi:pimeloyl-ACP methyl ester carboxylesterase
MATFVLVHGAWHGGWCYARVARKLRAAGHEVYTPTLTGVGERAHLACLDVTLSLHIKDICNVIKYENLNDFILCGHSYGGLVITGVAAELGERIRTLFYLDAFVPDDGQCLFDFLPAEQVSGFVLGAKATGGHLPPIPTAAFNVNAADAAWVEQTCVPQAIATFAEPVKLTGKEKKVKNRTYVLATGYDMHVFDQFHEKLKGDRAWKVRTAACGHDVMLDMPDELTKLLLEEVDR